MDKDTPIMNGITLTLQSKWDRHPLKTMSWHSDAPDESLEDIVNGFFSCLVGLTWHPDSIIQEFKNFVDEHDSEKD